jgi:hypothetical protein
VTYPADRLYDEVGYLAYHFHWPPDVILDMEHPERLRYVAQAARLAPAGGGAR